MAGKYKYFLSIKRFWELLFHRILREPCVGKNYNIDGFILNGFMKYINTFYSFLLMFACNLSVTNVWVVLLFFKHAVNTFS